MYKDLTRLREVKVHSLLGLKDNGRRQSIRCPFHNERDASFSLYTDGSYYCFGCTKSGQNSIDFLQELGASFPEIIEELSKYV